MDKIYRGVLNKGKIRIFIADTSLTCSKICQLHNLNFTCSDALSRVLSITAIMGIMQKMGKLSVKIEANGPIKTIICESDENANIRGLISNKNIEDGLKVEQAIGNKGFLSVVKDFGMKRNFTSQIELINGKIGDDFSYYFKESEQVPSLVGVGTVINDGIFYSGSLIVQLMPGYKEEDLLYLENFQKLCPPMRDILLVKDKKSALKELFPDIEILSEHDVNFQCSCNKDKFINGIACLNLDEINSMIDENKDYEVYCNFCNKKYIITNEDLKKSLNIRISKEKELN